MFSDQETADPLRSPESEMAEGQDTDSNRSHRHSTPSSTKPEPASVEAALSKLSSVRDELQKIIRGKEDVIDLVLTAMLAGGSVLLEDVPGVGKTTLAKSLASLIDLQFARVQCTPDLLPADILGSSIFQPSTGEFEFRPGPIFCDLLIADEINRASPRTQSALLEAMAESQVTIDGHRYDLHQPFMVIATQNPSGFEGTFPLPESQLDRFLLRLSMNYPDQPNEVEMLLDAATDSNELSESHSGSHHIAASQNGSVSAVDHPVTDRLMDRLMDRCDLLTLQAAVRDVRFDRKVATYIVDLATATRRDTRIRVGCSPRGSKMLLAAARSHALLNQRTYVLPDDVQALAVYAMAHRMSSRGGLASATSCDSVIAEILEQTAVPS